MAMRRIYNYPWSGRLGGHMLGRCAVCGESGPRLQISSRPETCVGCDIRDADPGAIEEMEAEAERRARVWCAAHNVDYDATVASYERNLGAMEQDVEAMPANCGVDYTVYIGPRPGRLRNYLDLARQT